MKSPVVILWQGRRFGCCKVTLYTVAAGLEEVHYILEDSEGYLPERAQLINFRPVHDRGVMLNDLKVATTPAALVDSLNKMIELRYAGLNYTLYSKELSNGLRH